MYKVLRDPESGERWEVRRSYVSDSVRMNAVRQAKWLLGQAVSCVAHKRHQSLLRATMGLTSSTIHFQDSTRSMGLPTLEQYPEIASAIPDIIELSKRTATATDDSANTVSFLWYGPFARLGWHRDEEKNAYADDTIAVNLVGYARISLIDPDSGRIDKLMKPGDALYLDNSGDVRTRVMHKAQNIAPLQRVVLVD